MLLDTCVGQIRTMFTIVARSGQCGQGDYVLVFGCGRFVSLQQKGDPDGL